MPKVHIALQELIAVVLMLQKLALWLSYKVVALHLENSTAKIYIYNQDGTKSLLLSRPACYILNLAKKHDITIIPTYTPTHVYLENEYLSWGRLVLEWHLFV